MPVTFNLVQAKRFRDEGTRQRRAIMDSLRPRQDGIGLEPTARISKVVDCVFKLQTAVLSSFLAIESLANHAIETLPEDTTIKRQGKELDKAAMVRRLSIDEKLRQVPPLSGGGPLPGSEVWNRYLALKNLRNEIVHVKKRGLRSDPDDPSAFDRLLLGEGDDCVEVAIDLIEIGWPDFLLPHHRAELGLSSRAGDG